MSYKPKQNTKPIADIKIDPRPAEIALQHGNITADLKRVGVTAKTVGYIAAKRRVPAKTVWAIADGME